MRKIWDIPGGVHPAENKSQSTGQAIKTLPLATEIVLPLSQHIGAEAMPTVAVGDKVLKGQCLAEAQGLISVPVHASTSGEIIAIEDRPIPHASGLLAKCIVISPDGQDTWIELTPCDDYTQCDKRSLVDKIRAAGIAGMGGAGFPTAVKLSPRADQQISTLILNATECEPYITADDMLMRERADDIIAGAELLAYLLDMPDEVIIGIEDNKPEAIAAMHAAASKAAALAQQNLPSSAKRCRIEIATFPTKYPSGGEKQLIQILTGKEVPSGGIPAQLGIVVQNIGTAVAAYRAVRYGEPLISRITTIVGESLGQQGNVEVLLGTPIAHVLEHFQFNEARCARMIIGGPMMGYAITRTDIPIIKTTNCVLLPSHSEMPEQAPAQACIRCGMCAEACPASLLPQQLFWFAQAEDVEKLNAHNLFDCIECGACSYVCPSNIPLVQYYRASKGIIRQQEVDKEKADRSRARFDMRKERMEKAEAEKEAKRVARKKAAEEAKKKLAAQKDQATGPTDDKNSSSASPSTEERQAQAPAVSRAKLERALSSANSRVERARAQLETAQAETENARIDSLKARLKQAELNSQEAQNKLDDFDSSANSPVDQHAAAGDLAARDKTADKADMIVQKISLSPQQKAQKNIATLSKRIHTAEEKLAEAQLSGSATAEALHNGVLKLREKLKAAEQDLEQLNAASPSADSLASEAATNTQEARALSAADIAIQKAQEKAAQLASMSDDEKHAVQIRSLKQRLEKAQARLQDAEKNNSEHIDALRNSVEKLQAKLSSLESQGSTV